MTLKGSVNLLSGFVLLFITGCMENEVQYEYSDGSANLYLITPQSLQYFPVQPEESSTGMYSGGTPYSVRLSASDYKNLKNLLDLALEDQANHQSSRTKMSCLIVRMRPTDTTIIRPGAPALSAIEATLHKLKPE